MAGLKLHNPGRKNFEIRKCVALSSNNEAMFVGQLVDLEGAANSSAIKTAGNKYPAGTLPSIKVVANGATNAGLGVVVGFDGPSDDSVIKHRVASVERVVHVLIPDESCIFEIVDDASGSPAASMVGANANVVGNTTGSTSTGEADTKFDATTPAADATYQLKVIGLRGGFEGNAADALADGCTWLVKLNLRREANAIVGV